MNTEEVTPWAAAVAMVGTVGAGLKWALPHFLMYLERRRDFKTREGIERVQDVYNTFEEIVNETSADRVIQFVGHNSGGIPRVEAAFYCTAIRWRVKDRPELKAGINLSDYFKVPVDRNYIRMLLECERAGHYRFKPEEEEECQLKSYYRLEGVTDSLIVFLKIKKKQFHYISIATFKEGGFSENDITVAMLKLGKVKVLV